MMKLKTTLFLLLLGGTFGMFLSAENIPPHDFHTSLAEVNYNAESRSFEVSLRVFLDDLEKGVGQANKQENLRLDKSDKHTELIRKYIGQHFYLLNSKKQKLEFKFYGKEIEGEVCWLYFEIPVKKNLKGYQLFNSILTEIFSDQMNMVNIFYGEKKKTFIGSQAKIKFLLDLA